mgnify:CR=1 FL=1
MLFVWFIDAELYSYFMPATYVPFGHLFLVNFNYQFHVSDNKTCGKAGFPKMKHILPYGSLPIA